MPTTTKWGLRYPAAADAANVPLDMQELAEDLENNALPLSGTLGARPTPGATRIGLTYYSTDTGVLSVWTGSAWIDIPTGTGSGAQPGDIKATGRTSAPPGWLLCDGASLLRADFAALFTAIGTTYGSVDGTHFNIPDVRGRVPVGVDGAAARLTSNDALGNSGGAETHTLSEAQIPPIQGRQTGGTGGVSVYTISMSGLTSMAGVSMISNSTDGITRGQSHPNMQPFLIVNYAIKT